MVVYILSHSLQRLCRSDHAALAITGYSNGSVTVYSVSVFSI